MRRAPGGPGWLGFALGVACGLLVGVVLALVLGGGGTTETRTVTRAATPPASTGAGGTVVTVTAVPDVIGSRLDVAKQRVRRAGFDVRVTGGGAFGIIREENWRVVAQDPPSGNQRERGSAVTLNVDRG